MLHVYKWLRAEDGSLWGVYDGEILVVTTSESEDDSEASPEHVR